MKGDTYLYSIPGMKGDTYLYSFPGMKGDTYLYSIPGTSMKGYTYLYSIPGMKGDTYLHSIPGMKGVAAIPFPTTFLPRVHTVHTYIYIYVAPRTHFPDELGSLLA